MSDCEHDDRRRANCSSKKRNGPTDGRNGAAKVMVAMMMKSAGPVGSETVNVDLSLRDLGHHFYGAGVAAEQPSGTIHNGQQQAEQ